MLEPTPWVLDVSKATAATAEEKSAQVKAGQASLLAIATAFLRKLQKAIGLVPLEVRCMAYFIWINARTFCPERSTVLLGGFIFLRIINPALVSPEANKLLNESEKLPASFKTNCIALCRLLQMLSNNKRYPAEEGALLNTWLEQNHEAMDSFLLDVATDPNYVEGARPFAAQSRLPDDRHRRLREALEAPEWDALHVALLHSKTHVFVRSALMPVLSSGTGGSASKSPRSSTPSSSSSSPVRSRSGSRFRGEEEELAIYNDGKMRVRPARRGSLTGGALFSNMSQPSLPVSVSPSSTSGSGFRTASPSAISSPGLARSDSVDGGSRLTKGSRARSLAGSNAGSPLIGSGSDNRSFPIQVLQREDNSSIGEESPEKAFFALLETLPLPDSVRLERFEKLIEPLKRPNLVAEGVLSDSRRGSMKIGPSQTELLVRMAKVLIDKEFGIKG